MLYTFRENQRPRLKLGRIPFPMFPYYSAREFWDSIEVLSKSNVVSGGGRPVGDIWLEGDSFIAALGVKGGKEIYVMTPHGRKPGIAPPGGSWCSCPSRPGGSF